MRLVQLDFIQFLAGLARQTLSKCMSGSWTKEKGWTKNQRQVRLKQTFHGMFYAYLAFGVYINHRSIRPTLFQWCLALCPHPVDRSHSGSRKTNRNQRASCDGFERRTSVSDLHRVLNRAVWSCRQASP